MINKLNCKICFKVLAGKQTRFCSKECKNKFHQSYNSQKSRGLDRKLNLLRLAGEKCSKCGYNKNISALSFHHLDSDKKDFKLDMRSLSNRTLEKVMTELQKCILLCNNCHAEVHNPDLELEKLSLSRLL